MAHYYNTAGRRFDLPERPMEPPDCWGEDAPELDWPEYDRYEDELEGIHDRRGNNNGD